MNTTEVTRKSLIKRFHTLLGRYGIDNKAKEGLLAGFGVESSTELDVNALLQLCEAVERIGKPEDEKMDKLRKRLIAGVGAWLRAMGKTESIDLIKGIIRRASGGVELNKLTSTELNSLYNAFLRSKKDLSNVRSMAAEDLEVRSMLN